ncbi:unnamed protein product [Heligmosomoides polygyrus]|uniref:SPATA6 domain-containing protein n=1 Tax=Heligmosomoides polygyrus TaxID=6339 RepID=A0A183FSS3_HELPZ|nr:unnamed protein product [Heligmosomoides polygyrus]
MPPLLELTPSEYRNKFCLLHPSGSHVLSRPPLPYITKETVTTELTVDVYGYLPDTGYLGQPSASNPLLILELTRLPDIIVFRQNAMLLLDRLLYRGPNHLVPSSLRFRKAARGRRLGDEAFDMGRLLGRSPADLGPGYATVRASGCCSHTDTRF